MMWIFVQRYNDQCNTKAKSKKIQQNFSLEKIIKENKNKRCVACITTQHFLNFVSRLIRNEYVARNFFSSTHSCCVAKAISDIQFERISRLYFDEILLIVEIVLNFLIINSIYVNDKCKRLWIPKTHRCQ